MGEIKQSLKVRGLKGEVRVNAVLDSGDSTSYIRESISKKIGLVNLGDVEFEIADGRKLSGFMSSVLVFIKQRFSETQIIVTPNLKEQVILGQNFMQQNDLLLDSDKVKFNITQSKIRRIYKI